jgi:6-phosphofructokinase 2
MQYRIATLTLNPALDITTATQTVRPEDKLRCSEPQFDPGGGGINVARAITGLGGQVVAIFPYGGSTGQRLRGFVEDYGVSTCAVPIAGETRESFTVDETETGREFRFVLPGPTLSPSERQACIDALLGLEPAPSHVVASGSLPPGMDAGVFGMLADACRQRGARLVIDNANLTLDALAGCQVELIKLNQRELGLMLGRAIDGEDEIVEAARAIITKACAKAVIVSRAKAGAMLITGEEVRSFPAYPVEPKSTVGAGDSMVAGIVLALSRGAALDRAVQFGMATGAAALSTPRTELLHRSHVECILGESLDLFLAG